MLKKVYSPWVAPILAFCFVSLVVIVATTGQADAWIVNTLAGCSLFFLTFALVEVLNRCRDRQLDEGCNALILVMSTFLSLELVNKTLHVLASNFDKACRAQVALCGAEHAEAQLLNAGNYVTETKTAFWEAYHLANILGYKVGTRVSDYYTYPPVFTEPDR